MQLTERPAKKLRLPCNGLTVKSSLQQVSSLTRYCGDHNQTPKKTIIWHYLLPLNCSVMITQKILLGQFYPPYVAFFIGWGIALLNCKTRSPTKLTLIISIKISLKIYFLTHFLFKTFEMFFRHSRVLAQWWPRKWGRCQVFGRHEIISGCSESFQVARPFGVQNDDADVPIDDAHQRDNNDDPFAAEKRPQTRKREKVF